MKAPEPCTSPDGHVWEEADIAGCDLCGEHAGLVCIVEGCYETVDFVWEKDPRDDTSGSATNPAPGLESGP